ncbi:hypothetical protein CANINC_002853 [Pichia inconspicua]|uniref:RNA polymerase II-associated protein RBA50 n=1 Tax=Pichia inconspicua TaxID=52247 RepID=A0A4T0X0I3_9ASCO|nr:hypothetical protein CANINC_002853 [[Candida] inconspicua]
MDLLGDIVEHETTTPVAPMTPLKPQVPAVTPLTGFPAAQKRAPSKWRQRLQEKGISSISGAVEAKEETPKKFYTKDESTGLKKFRDSGDRKLDYTGLSEAEQIHQENIEILTRMSVEEREEHKQELLDSLDPKVLQMLMRRSRKKYGPPGEEDGEVEGNTNIDPLYEPVEGSMGTWVGGEHELDKPKRSNSGPGEKKIRFEKEAKVIHLDQTKSVIEGREAVEDALENEWEDVEELEPEPTPGFHEIELENEHQHNHSVHFPKPPQPFEPLDINDPQFNDKLYEKYFPELPRNPNQLEWMQPVPETPKDISYDGVETVRFDFRGDIITNANIGEYIGENKGLHNHAANPELPGYTLPELGHYLRSTFPGQVCIACRTLGRILYKLGTLSYDMVIGDDSCPTERGVFEKECWELVEKLQIIELLQKYAQESERNLSVRNYAIDALWLWCQGKNEEEKSTQ